MLLLAFLVLCVLSVFLVGRALADLHKEKALADHDARRIAEIERWAIAEIKAWAEVDPNRKPDPETMGHIWI